ncbi:MAG: NAD+ synthase [Pseudomonadota bacterium]
MPCPLNITIVQANFIVGDIKNNVDKIISIYQQITQTTNKIIPDLIVFSELAITGYPAEDLYLQPYFQEIAFLELERLKTAITKTAIIVGNIAPTNSKPVNKAYLIKDSKIIDIASKYHLPNYGVFDEQRYFTPEIYNQVFQLKGHNVGVLICEDMWFLSRVDSLIKQGAKLVIVINASPFNIEKDKKRKALAKNICQKYEIDFIYANQIGGQDELVFDGGSFAFNSKAEQIANLSYFKEEIANIKWNESNRRFNSLSQTEAIYQALTLGLKDYVHKNKFKKVLLGLSGGIDSALTAAIAVDALGPDNVVAIMLPSKYTSKESLIDAEKLAQTLNIELKNIPIEEITNSIRKTLSNSIDLEQGSITDQNIQARTRGLLLMSLSNQLGFLLLSTGNKSENAVGYSTLYGDMCGGFNPLKDIYKTQVFELAKYRKLPKEIIEKAPSAELCYDQKDQDSLPEYILLDKILFHLIEENLSKKEIIAKGYDSVIVEKISYLLKRAEYKRRQSAPGPIISTRSLNLERRYPITNSYKN